MRDLHTGRVPFRSCITGAITDQDAVLLDVPEVTKSIVGHVQTSLARAPYNLDDFGAYQASALSVRDNLIVSGFHCVLILPLTSHPSGQLELYPAPLHPQSSQTRLLSLP